MPLGLRFRSLMHKQTGFLLVHLKLIFMTKKIFTKPQMSVADLIVQWKSRGLIIPDEDRAIRYLNYINYYRFSVYTIPFQIENDPTHTFLDNVNFDDILETYVFDRELRLLVLDALERVEVAIKSQLCNLMCEQTNDAFWLFDETHFLNKTSHQKFLTSLYIKIKNETKNHDDNSHQTPIQHFHSIYDGPNPPVWMVFEILSFGEISRLYRNLKNKRIKRAIAINLGLNEPLLHSWSLSLSHIRNIVAHHSRLWNRVLGTSLAIPTSTKINWIKNTSQSNNEIITRRLYGILVALQVILYQISPSSEWAKRFKSLLEKYPNIPHKAMRIPENWEEDPFWEKALA